MGDRDAVLEPGTVIKPQMTVEDAVKLLFRLYGLRSVSVKEFNSYDDKNFYFKVEEETHNPHLTSVCPDGYILKVTNRIDSKDPAFTEAQNMMILHMAKAGLAVPEPQRNLSGDLASLEVGVDRTDPDIRNMVRLLKYIPGKTFYDIGTWTTEHFLQCGEFIARMDDSLSSFSHLAYDSRNSIWFLNSIPEVKNFVSAVQDDARKELVMEIMNEFTDTVLSVVDQLKQQIIHGDFNEQNILCRRNPETEEQEIYSVIDFGDSQRNPQLYELGIAIMYMMTKCTVVEPAQAGGYVVAGYLRHRGLTGLERKLLRITVAARYCQSLVMGAYSHSLEPDNDYLLITSQTGWETLTAFWTLPKEELYRDWDSTITSQHPAHAHYLTSAL